MLQIEQNQPDHKYVYVFVRRDIPLQHQMAQACHGALEAGKAFPQDRNHTDSIIVIGVKNQKELLKSHKYLEEHGIKTIMFWEPSWDYGETSFGTNPIAEENRHIFRRFQLWKP